MGMIGNIVSVSPDELKNFLENTELMEAKIFDEHAHQADWLLDLDKAWEGIHYLLSGKGMMELETPNVLTRAFFTFQIINEGQDLGYNAQYLTAEQVQATNTELQKIDRAALRQKTSGSAMNTKDIYPCIWDDEDGMDYLFDTFDEFCDFYAKTAQKKYAIITFIS